MPLLNQISVITLLLVAVLFAVKYYQKVSYQKVDKRHIPLKWMLWFSKYDIYSTTTDKYRRYMKTSNGLSIALAIALIAVVIIFLLMALMRG